MNQVGRSHNGVTSRLWYAIDLMPFFLVGWQVAFSSNLHLISGLLVMAVCVIVVRFVAPEIRQKRRLTRSVLILGNTPMAARLIDEIESSDDRRYVVAGIVDDQRPSVESWGNTRWLGPSHRLAEIVDRVRPERIVVALADRRGHLPVTPLLESRVRGIVVEDAVEFHEHLTGKIAIEALSPSSLFLSKGFRNHGAAQMTARVISVVVAAVGLVFCTPLLVAIAVAIKLDSRGPVLFVQERAGRGGRSFRLLKLRTMHPCDDRLSEWVRDNTERITRVGKWLRRFRLDELPQLANVLRGDMNLIGPRPHPTCNQKIFVERIAYYGLRSTIRPGVTGWAQVRYGYANNLEEETEKMRYDLYYIKNRSVWLDFRILLETVLMMLLARGATEVRRRRTPVQLGTASPTPWRHSSEPQFLRWAVGSSPAQRPAARQ